MALRIVGSDDAEVVLLSETLLRIGRTQNLTGVLENLEAALESVELKNAPLETLAYLDLRFGDKVSYKFK